MSVPARSQVAVSRGGFIAMIVVLVVLVVAVIVLGVVYGLQTARRKPATPAKIVLPPTPANPPQSINALAGGLGPMQLPGPLAGITVPGVRTAATSLATNDTMQRVRQLATSTGQGLLQQLTQPTPDAPAGPAPARLAARADHVATADQVRGLIADPTRSTVVIVASEGCGACHRLRSKLTQMPLTPTDSVVVLTGADYAQLSSQFPAEKVPQMFKVGKGQITRGPLGDMPADQLLAYIRAP